MNPLCMMGSCGMKRIGFQGFVFFVSCDESDVGSVVKKCDCAVNSLSLLCGSVFLSCDILILS